MCAAKSSSRPSLQRVAKHLYRRGNSYEFFRRIPQDARHLFGGITTKSESFGDVSYREAEHLAAELRKQTDRLIAQARKQPDPTIRAFARRASALPTQGDMDRAVRDWLAKQEANITVSPSRAEVPQRVQDLSAIAELTPKHQRDRRSGSLLNTAWIAEAIADMNGWSITKGSDEHQYLLDRVGRAQREAALRIRAEINYEDRPHPTHSMFAPEAFERDRQQPTTTLRDPVAIMEIFERYSAEQEPAPKTRKKWKVALTSLIEHLGHDDASRVTPEDIVNWKDMLLEVRADGTKPRGQGTVRNG